VTNNNLIIIIIIINIKKNNNNNIQDSVYGAVIMPEPLREQPVHLMNVEQRQAAADPRPSQTT